MNERMNNNYGLRPPLLHKTEASGQGSVAVKQLGRFVANGSGGKWRGCRRILVEAALARQLHAAFLAARKRSAGRATDAELQWRIQPPSTGCVAPHRRRERRAGPTHTAGAAQLVRPLGAANAQG